MHLSMRFWTKRGKTKPNPRSLVKSNIYIYTHAHFLIFFFHPIRIYFRVKVGGVVCAVGGKLAGDSSLNDYTRLRDFYSKLSYSKFVLCFKFGFRLICINILCVFSGLRKRRIINPIYRWLRTAAWDINEVQLRRY